MNVARAAAIPRGERRSCRTRICWDGLLPGPGIATEFVRSRADADYAYWTNARVAIWSGSNPLPTGVRFEQRPALAAVDWQRPAPRSSLSPTPALHSRCVPPPPIRQNLLRVIIGAPSSFARSPKYRYFKRPPSSAPQLLLVNQTNFSFSVMGQFPARLREGIWTADPLALEAKPKNCQVRDVSC